MHRKTTFFTLMLLLLPAALLAQIGFRPNPDLLGWEFPDTPVGGISEIDLTIISLNDEDFQEVTIRIGNDPDMEGGFAVEPDDAFVLVPDGANNVGLLFSPEEAGRYEALIEFFVLSNDPGEPGRVYEYELSGRGIEIQPPRMEVEPEEFEFWFVTGIGGWVETEAEINISNTGGSGLRIGDVEADEDWLEIVQEDFEIEPGEEITVTVSVINPDDFEMGDYFTSITIRGNDPNNQLAEILVTFVRDHVIWIPEPTEESHAIIIEEARIDGELLEPGDCIGVFTPAGLMAGACEIFDEDELFPVGVAAWGDDPQTIEIEGFRDGEIMLFKLWDSDTGTEYDAIPVYEHGAGFWIADGISIISELNNVPEGDFQMVELDRGWSIVSSNRDFYEEFCNDDGPDFQLILADILDEVLIFKNIQGEFCIPGMDFWWFRNWDVSQGYLIKVSDDVELQIHGEPIEFDRPIELHAGWNMIAYYPDYEADFEIACENILDHVIIAKDALGRFWVPDSGFPVLPMIPGQGYMVKVDEDCQLRYPLENPDGDQVASDERSNPSHYTQPTLTDQNMSLVIESIDGLNIADKSEIACFNQDGGCVGSAVLKGKAPWGMTAWGDDRTTETIDGLVEGETLQFRLWDAATGEEYNLTAGIDQDIAYSKDTLTRIELAVPDEASQMLPESDCLNAFAFPNPFNGLTTLQFKGSSNDPTTISVFDLSGRIIDVIEVNPAESGMQSVPLDMSKFSDGIYLVKVQNGQYKRMIRTLLLK